VAAKPVLKSSGDGPVRGTLLMGRLLDEKAIRRVAEQASVQLRLSPIRAAGGEVPFTRQQGGAIPYVPPVLRESPSVTLASTTLGDVRGQPALLLEVDTPRDISARGATALRFALISMLLAGLVVVLVLLVLLRQTVLDPVSRLTRHAVTVGERGDLTARLSMARGDEMGVLAREFDRMVEHLAEARRQLVDQSYRSGVAEMASGVLHNLRNAITPLNVKLQSVSSDIVELPAAEARTAMEELRSDATTAGRREDLMRFLELATQEMARVVTLTSHKLGEIVRQFQHVQQILSDQEQFSRAARVLETVAVGELVARGLEFLPQEIRDAMTVEIDPSVSRAGPVSAARVALQQVVSNLLTNAAEAILEQGGPAGDGRLRVLAERARVEGTEMVHLRFEDNGVGIDAGGLSHIFERGFSTKGRRSSGLGLHWSAITVISMGGRMFAESQGIGQGATLHLLLPLGGGERENAAMKG
jgi:two-component system NtrC family sensor kinase